MAVLPIRITGEPVLHAPAEPVTAFDAELEQLVADLYETMDAAPGVGLAAPQVGVGLRVFVFGWTDADGREWRGEAINPELWLSPSPVGWADEDDDAEGCLSVPGERFELLRAQRAVLRAVDLQQQPFEIEAEGWLARIFQHEYDHLDGVLYIDRLETGLRKTAEKAIKKARWGVPGHSWMPGEDDLDA